jgi:erythromycin 12 hydroxylase
VTETTTDNPALVPSGEDEPALLDWLSRMREEQPVWRDGTGIWHLFRHEDVEAVTRDPETFSSDTGRIFPEARRAQRGMLTAIDPPEHRALRRLVSTAFTPRTVAGLEPRIRTVTRELLDAVGDRFDLVDALAFPLPVIVIAELLGLPTSDRGQFRAWADDLFSMQVDPGDPELGAKVTAATAGITGYLAEKCRARRADPGSDLMSALVTAEVDGRQLDDEEATNFSMLLLLAGHITTTLLLGNAVRTFDENPGVWDELRADPGLIPPAIEEVLRLRTPFTQIGRATTRDVERHGVTIPANVVVTPWLLAASRDPRVHRDPDRFDLGRGLGGGNQLAFGHGIHFCLGAPLARLEGRVALQELTGRFRELRVDHDAVAAMGGMGGYPRGILGVRRLPVIARPT